MVCGNDSHEEWQRSSAFRLTQRWFVEKQSAATMHVSSRVITFLGVVLILHFSSSRSATHRGSEGSFLCTFQILAQKTILFPTGLVFFFYDLRAVFDIFASLKLFHAVSNHSNGIWKSLDFRFRLRDSGSFGVLCRGDSRLCHGHHCL